MLNLTVAHKSSNSPCFPDQGCHIMCLLIGYEMSGGGTDYEKVSYWTCVIESRISAELVKKTVHFHFIIFKI